MEKNIEKEKARSRWEPYILLGIYGGSIFVSIFVISKLLNFILEVMRREGV